MKKATIYFLISALIGLGIGYLVFDVMLGKNSQTDAIASSDTSSEESSSTTDATTEESKGTETAVSAEAEILNQKGCLGCHAVSSLDLSGGATGPDLSQAFNNVEGKHGKPVNEFLKEPTSAVMSGVISGSPLSDDEISKITELLQKAAEAN
ncbi:cytochrome C [Bacillus marasmi]|uniref:cytochrome C n=1 Tax=Bacillus marasmi TaxID=1926279 RepID=UPI00164CED60|nr:cytochrome C [Bacillus marasmi]